MPVTAGVYEQIPLSPCSFANLTTILVFPGAKSGTGGKGKRKKRKKKLRSERTNRYLRFFVALGRFLIPLALFLVNPLSQKSLVLFLHYYHYNYQTAFKSQ
jgi:hypothetical protein